jgi:glutamine amidotransferase
MKTVVVIDYGMSNLRSVSKALSHVSDWKVVVSDKAETIVQADKVVFPGQGAIGNCMNLLKKMELDSAIRQSMATKPFLGICLGLQTLLTFSEESGGTSCFDVITGKVRRFPDSLCNSDTGEKLKIPHMGWNQVFQRLPHPLWRDIADNSRFYFVHSYYVDAEDENVIAGTTTYGLTFTSAAAKDNIFAVQFHPEKSQHAGLTLLRNFLNL